VTEVTTVKSTYLFDEYVNLFHARLAVLLSPGHHLVVLTSLFGGLVLLLGVNQDFGSIKFNLGDL